VEELTEQVVDATHPFSETLEGGSLQGKRVTSVEMALYLGPQKRGCFLTTLCSAMTSLLQVKCPFACHVNGGEWSVSSSEFFAPGKRGHYH